MSKSALFSWLAEEGVADEISNLAQLTVCSEIDNLE